MEKKRVNALNPTTGKLAVAIVIEQKGNQLTVRFSDGTIAILHSKDVTLF